MTGTRWDFEDIEWDASKRLLAILDELAAYHDRNDSVTIELTGGEIRKIADDLRELHDHHNESRFSRGELIDLQQRLREAFQIRKEEGDHAALRHIYRTGTKRSPHYPPVLLATTYVALTTFDGVVMSPSATDVVSQEIDWWFGELFPRLPVMREGTLEDLRESPPGIRKLAERLSQSSIEELLHLHFAQAPISQPVAITQLTSWFDFPNEQACRERLIQARKTIKNRREELRENKFLSEGQENELRDLPEHFSIPGPAKIGF